MAKKDTPEQAEFRAHARNWLEENRPAPPRTRLPEQAIEVASEEHREYLCEWQKKCYQAGLVACDYPSEYGGGGHSGFQRIANQEMGKMESPSQRRVSHSFKVRNRIYIYMCIFGGFSFVDFEKSASTRTI